MIRLKIPEDLCRAMKISRPKSRRELDRLLSKLGCRVVHNSVDFRVDDCTDWYWTDGNPILAVEKNWLRFELICVGDIRIYGSKKFFVYKCGLEASGKLTAHLKKNGRWENNNWFEVIVRDLVSGDTDSEEDVHYSLREALGEFIAQCNSPLFSTDKN